MRVREILQPSLRPLSFAQDVATEYLRDQSYRSHRQRTDALSTPRLQNPSPGAGT